MNLIKWTKEWWKKKPSVDVISNPVNYIQFKNSIVYTCIYPAMSYSLYYLTDRNSNVSVWYIEYWSNILYILLYIILNMCLWKKNIIKKERLEHKDIIYQIYINWATWFLYSGILSSSYISLPYSNLLEKFNPWHT